MKRILAFAAISLSLMAGASMADVYFSDGVGLSPPVEVEFTADVGLADVHAIHVQDDAVPPDRFAVVSEDVSKDLFPVPLSILASDLATVIPDFALSGGDGRPI